MDPVTLLIEAVIVLVMIAVAVSAVRAWRIRPPQLKPLPGEALNRYVVAWERIEARFVDAPEEAVRAADALIVSMLGERGHTLELDRLPSRFLHARRLGMTKEGRHRTENLRRALLDYRAIFERTIGTQDRDQVRAARQELA
jgi:hypothetical protein